MLGSEKQNNYISVVRLERGEKREDNEAVVLMNEI